MAIFTFIATSIAVALIGAGLVATAIGGVIGALASSFVLGAISKALSPKPQQQASIAVSGSDRQLNVRQPITARQVIYGQIKVGGPFLFVHTTNSNAHLHLIVALAGHEVAEIGAVYFNDEVVPVNTDGTVSGRFAGIAFVYKHLGSTTQAADANLIANAGGTWTTAHRLQGIAYLYVKLVFSASIFGPIGIPTITAIVKGKKVYDPRTLATVWSDNPALCLSDYLTDTRYSLGAAYSEIDETALIAAANACDEFVNLSTQDVTITADPASDILGLTEPPNAPLTMAQLIGTTAPPPKPEAPKARLLTGTQKSVSPPPARCREG
jgi:hypothetical protein